MKRWNTLAFASTAVLLGLLPLALAHGDEDMNMGGDAPEPAPAKVESPPSSYFRYKEHSNVILAHIVLMVIGWGFVLPVGKQTTRRSLLAS